MITSIIKIGNSRGLVLNKSILDNYNIIDKVEIILENDCIIIKPLDEPRKNWAATFEKMNLNNDDQLLIDDLFENDTFEE